MDLATAHWISVLTRLLKAECCVFASVNLL